MSAIESIVGSTWTAPPRIFIAHSPQKQPDDGRGLPLHAARKHHGFPEQG
jgi:hypothetical protein